MKDARAIIGELKKFSADLLDKPRWLVFNKSDLLPAAGRRNVPATIVRRLRFKGPHFLISAATGARPSWRSGYDVPEQQRSADAPRLSDARRAAGAAEASIRGLQYGLCRSRSSRLGHRTNAGRESALVPVGLIAVNDVLAHQGVDYGNGFW